MAAIAHSDPYAIFMRKIGYSVGLERTLQRVGALEMLYAKNRDVTASSWEKLVTDPENWGLKSSNNITDFFYSLRLIQRTAGDILVLENLDAISIVNALLKNTQERDEARAFLVLWAILVNDGEIFVNSLLAGFEEEKVKTALSTMLLRKREILGSILSGKESAKRINRIITIERQENNKGSAGIRQSVVSLKRTEPIKSEKTNTNPGSIVFSEDYFRKIPPRRKDWARSLGLWNDEIKFTQRGDNLIHGLTETGYINSNGENRFFTYWPMDYELVRVGFRPDLLGESTKSLWQCLVDFGGAYADLSVKSVSERDADDAVALISQMMKHFRSLHVRKAMLRREMPITVVYPVAIAYACATREPVLDLPAAIEAEQRSERRRLAFRQSRHTGGALSLKR